MIPGSGGPVVDSHEVGVIRKLGNEFAYAMPMSYSSYRSDGHEALLRGCVHPVGDLVQSLIEVPDGECFSKSLASIYSFSVPFAPSVLGISSLMCG
jgi:hypothetical protein